jgi:hypothetical protein
MRFVFLSSNRFGWKRALCHCEHCERFYEKNKLSFLFEEKQASEPTRAALPVSIVRETVEKIAALPTEKQLELFSAYHQLREVGEELMKEKKRVLEEDHDAKRQRK